MLVVFADHMFGWPSGGFLGVDVFFVISGFLITGLLLREYDRSGHISFRKFYVGRLKRIVPSATVVIIFVIAFSFALFTQQRAVSVAWDALWAFIFVANWNFAAAGTDYFQQGTAVSPLQHYWSLSVEEQFYFVWPWLLLGLLVLFARFVRMTDKRARLIAGTTIGVISIASFAWALMQSIEAPTVAYFSTLTRGWELGVGALVAIAAPLFTRIPRVVRTALAYAGLVGIFVSCFLITPESIWPAPWALLPVLATALVIVSGIGEQALYLAPLTNRVSVFIGDISYSLYLWHFPVIIFGHALYPNSGVWVYIGIAFVGFALAIAQYYAIEQPIWKSPLWVGRSARRGSPWVPWRGEYLDQIRYALTGGFAVLVIAVTGVAFVPPPPVSYTPPAPTASATESTDPPVPPAVANAREAIRTALEATSWPGELSPSIDTVGPDSIVDAWHKDGCLALERGAGTDWKATLDHCTYGQAEATYQIALVGDSIAISYLPAIQAAFPDARIHVMTMMQCPFAEVTVTRNDRSPHPECDEFHQFVADELGALQPSLIIASQTEYALHTRVGETTMADGLGVALTSFTSASERVVILPPPPQTPAITECYSPGGSPSACIAEPTAQHDELVTLLKEAAARSAGTEYIDTDQLFCFGNTCPAMADGYIIRADRAHLTQAFSSHLGAPLAELLALR